MKSNKNLLYTQYAQRYADAISDNVFNSQYDRPSLLALLPTITKKRILDLGCGPGAYLPQLLQAQAIITAVDGSKDMVRLVQTKFKKQLLCYQQNLNFGLPKETNHSFDLVLSALTIHYIRDLNKLFLEISRVLKKSGQFVFSTHHPFHDFIDSPTGHYFKIEKLKQSWDTIGTPVDVTFYRRPLSAIIQALTQAGFLILDISEGRPSEKIKKTSKTNHTLLTTKPFFIFFKCQKK